jgi:hypothetical protein
MGGPDAIVAVGVLLDEGEILLSANHRTRVAGKSHDGKDAEHSVDSATLEAEVAEVAAGEQRSGRFNELGGGPPALAYVPVLLARPVVWTPLADWLLLSRLEL